LKPYVSSWPAFCSSGIRYPTSSDGEGCHNVPRRQAGSFGHHSIPLRFLGWSSRGRSTARCSGLCRSVGNSSAFHPVRRTGVDILDKLASTERWRDRTLVLFSSPVLVIVSAQSVTFLVPSPRSSRHGETRTREDKRLGPVVAFVLVRDRRHSRVHVG